VPIELYWKLYCYEVQLDSNLRQVSFDIIATTLNTEKGSEYDRKDWLMEEDAGIFDVIYNMFIGWVTEVARSNNEEFKEEKEFRKLMNSRLYHLCQRISNVKEPYQKKCKYQLLLLIRQIAKIV